MRPSPDDELDATYRSLHGVLLPFATERLGGDVPEAEDLLQDVWAAFAKTLHTQPVAQPRAWLYRALRNRITDAYRRAAARPARLPLSPLPPLAERDAAAVEDVLAEALDLELRPAPTAAEFWADVEEALARLPAMQREVFRRNVLEGETLREIAADLGVPLGTAISRKRYARERLRGLLGECTPTAAAAHAAPRDAPTPGAARPTTYPSTSRSTTIASWRTSTSSVLRKRTSTSP